MHTYSAVEHLLFPPTRLNKQRLAEALSAKTVLITGASSGIGEQLAYLLASYNVHLILVARRESKLLDMKRDIESMGAKASVFSADLRNPQELNNLLNHIHQLGNGLDIVVSNAGHSIKRSLRQSLDRYLDVTRTMAINYLAPVQLVLSLFPLLEKRKGQFINVSTINTMLHPMPYWAAYQASKAAFDAWLRSASPELIAAGIAVTSIYLPLVRTPMILPTEEYRSLPAMTSEHAARRIARSIYSRRAAYKPWWIGLVQLGSILFRGTLEYQTLRSVKKREKQS
jgi:short-subunit dehydrogenase